MAPSESARSCGGKRGKQREQLWRPLLVRRLSSLPRCEAAQTAVAPAASGEALVVARNEHKQPKTQTDLGQKMSACCWKADDRYVHIAIGQSPILAGGPFLFHTTLCFDALFVLLLWAEGA